MTGSSIIRDFEQALRQRLVEKNLCTLLTVKTFHSKILEFYLFSTCHDSYDWTLEVCYLEIKHLWSYLYSDEL